MAKFIIEGSKPLTGEIKVAGNKNSALPIIAATVLTDEECLLRNVPEIRDVHAMLEILQDLGKEVHQESRNTYRIGGRIQKSRLRDDLAGRLRASILYISVMLARQKEISMVPPGGCVIGRRNVDSHFEVVSAFGGQFKIEEKQYLVRLPRAEPANIFLKEASVTATENALLLAAAISGRTIINNAACEPHVNDLVQVLIKMGAKIEGIGSNLLIIDGQSGLRGFDHRIMPDHIEAGTFAIAAACTRGELLIHDAMASDLYMTHFYLKQMGVDLKFIDEKTLQVRPSQLISRAKKIQVGLWPAFPTDLMSPMIVLATQAQGTTLCHDWMYESRMFFVDKLIIMGAEITQCDPHRVLVSGPSQLRGQSLSSPDIRAGIALVIAAMTARGTSHIDQIELIDRGYEDIAARLNHVGADIRRVEDNT